MADKLPATVTMEEIIEAPAQEVQHYIALSALSPLRYDTRLGSKEHSSPERQKQPYRDRACLGQESSNFYFWTRLHLLSTHRARRSCKSGIGQGHGGQDGASPLAHRLATIRNADVICVLLEKGTRRGDGILTTILLSADGLYAHLHTLQESAIE